MNGSLAMRSTRLRTLLLVLVGGGMLLSLYLLTSSQYHLKDARHLLEACQQQKDSLLAQLQVVYEQKNRVEKSLQQEKLDHRKTQEDNQKNNYLRLQVQKAKAEVDTKLSALQKEQLSLQDRYHELESQTKELRDQQTVNEEKQAKQLSEYEHNLRSKDEEITLLRGNLTLALQERDGLENQVVSLNNNIQQLKNEFLHYKRMYLDINERLKKLSEQKSQNDVVDSSKVKVKTNPKADNGSPHRVEPVNALTASSTQPESHQISSDVHAMPNAQGKEDNAAADSPQHNVENPRHPLQAPNIVVQKPVAEENKATSEHPAGAAGVVPDGHGEADRPGEAAGLPPSGLRQQLQPPDFGQERQHQAAEPFSAVSSSPSQAAVQAGVNQPLLPPPQPQESKQMDAHQVEIAPPQFQPMDSGKQNQVPQSQEQRDQDTMARKPILDQNPLGEGGQFLGQDFRGHEGMFQGALAPWNNLADLGQSMGQQQQIKSPDLKARPNSNNNNNNNRHQEEEENYPDDGDDDNAEEQDDTHDKNVKPFQDHDFEDNDGNDHNQAKEEGIVIAPK